MARSAAVLKRTIPTRVGRTGMNKRPIYKSSDHPHACGENNGIARMERPHNGPSPRVWGEPGVGFRVQTVERTIPTRVARTLELKLHRMNTTDHPHACGENIFSKVTFAMPDGPSPRVWGERPSQPSQPHRDRTIPTRVGRTSPDGLHLSPKTDHPHACGENVRYFFCCGWNSGPSPRVWGELRRLSGSFECLRTIPTRVGRTKWQNNSFGNDADHPHACGENSTTRCEPNSPNGPSPRVWGELWSALQCGQCHRTIPTRVGRTRSRQWLTQQLSDHPHACGENGGRWLCVHPRTGPSPRVWGELGGLLRGNTTCRTIPTRVGRTSPVRSWKERMSDHPHACGENVMGPTISSHSRGPSPRVWGEPGHRALVEFQRRTIPTRVGRTWVRGP